MTIRRSDRPDGAGSPAGGKTGIITLTMSRAFPHAAVSINSLNSQLGDSTRHFILLNDTPDDSIEETIAHPHRRFLCSGSNLGVAPGRNRLIEEALSWGANLVVVFDDDLISPSDYIETLVNEHHSLRNNVSNLGVVAPAIISHRFAAQLMPCLSYQSLRNATEPPPTTSVWLSALGTTTTIPTPGQIEHLGIRNWPEHYLGTGIRALRRYLERSGWQLVPPQKRSPVVANDRSAREDLTTGRTTPIPVDTLPGGVWCVGSDVLREVGPLEEAFAPFGFEDAEWCIRATEMGYQNFCAPSAIVAHDLQKRLSGRPAPEVFRTRSRSRSLLIRMHAPPTALVFAIVGAALESLDIAALPKKAQRSSLDEWISGFVEGLTRPTSRAGISPAAHDAESSIEATDDALGTVALKVKYTIDSTAILVDNLLVEWSDGAFVSAGCSLTRESASASWQGSATVTVNRSSALRHIVLPLADNLGAGDSGFIGQAATRPTGLSAHLATSQCDQPSRLHIDLDGEYDAPQTTITHSCGSWPG